MSVRSEIITCIPTNTAIPHLSAQLLSGPLSLLTVSSPSPVQQMEPFSYKLLTFLQAIFMDLCFSHNSPQNHNLYTASVFIVWGFFSSPPVLKTPLCQASKPGCGLVLAKQWAVQAFSPPAVGFWVEWLPSHVFGWACFTHTIDCRWCSGSSPADLDWTRCIIVRGGTTGDHTRICQQKHFGHQSLSCLAWRQSVGVGRFNCKTGNGGHASAVTSWMTIQAPHNPQLLHFFPPAC